jgi:hypothetical protein
MKPSFFVILFLLAGCSAASPVARQDDAGGGDAAEDALTEDDAGAREGGSTSTSCGPTNCKGCCEGNVCQIGDIALACGIGGAACATCGGSHAACLTNRTCGYQPDVAWHVTVDSAVIAATNGTAAWDASGGAPDPFVRLWCSPNASVPKVSTTIVDDLTPKWSTGADCFIPYEDLASKGFAIELLDEDIAVHDTILPKMTVVPKPADFASNAITVSNSVVKVTVRLE